MKKSLPFWGMLTSVVLSVAATWVAFTPHSLPLLAGNEVGLTLNKTKSIPSLVVDIEGAVVAPGVYELPAGSRLIDALLRAKGIAADADRAYIAKEMNLAKTLTNEEKIYVYFLGEQQESTQNSTLINLNTANKTELELLPHIGPVTAQKIIDRRPYQSFEELVSKRILSASALADLTVLISL